MRTMWNNEHVYDTFLDFGLLGELPVEVFYIWHSALASNDPYQVYERSYAELTGAVAMIEGKEIDVFGYVLKDQDLAESLAVDAGESYKS